MAEVYFRMVIEHHGGPNRLARLSAVIRPPKSSSWLVLILAGLSVTMFSLAYMVSAPLFGYFSDRIGCRRVLIGSLLGTRVLVKTQTKLLRLVFSGVIVLLGLEMLWKGITRGL